MQISDSIKNNYSAQVNLKQNTSAVSVAQSKNNTAVQATATPQQDRATKTVNSVDLAKEINELSMRKDVGVNFQKDELTGQSIVQFVDNSTQEVLRQFPSEEMLKVIQQIDKFLEQHSKSIPVGNLLNEAA